MQRYSDVPQPIHYQSLNPEPIDVIECWGLNYHLGNVLKYVVRSKYKGEELSDLQKALYYTRRWLEIIKQSKFVFSYYINSEKVWENTPEFLKNRWNLTDDQTHVINCLYQIVWTINPESSSYLYIAGLMEMKISDMIKVVEEQYVQSSPSACTQ